jgi:hypothetical protein
MMATRRQVSFADWDQVEADLRHLSKGYSQHGKWNLEQASRHLNDWLRFPMDGFPKAPWFVAVLMVAIRTSMGPRMLQKIIAAGKMQDRGPTVPATVYANAGDATATREAVEELCRTIARFRAHSGSIHPSPVFGPMDKQTAEKLQLVHFAHHLSWLEPTA